MVCLPGELGKHLALVKMSVTDEWNRVTNDASEAGGTPTSRCMLASDLLDSPSSTCALQSVGGAHVSQIPTHMPSSKAVPNFPATHE